MRDVTFDDRLGDASRIIYSLSRQRLTSASIRPTRRAFCRRRRQSFGDVIASSVYVRRQIRRHDGAARAHYSPQTRVVGQLAMPHSMPRDRMGRALERRAEEMRVFSAIG